MLPSGNKKTNSMQRKPIQCQEIEDLEDITHTPKQKFYQNIYTNVKNDNTNYNNINNLQKIE